MDNYPKPQEKNYENHFIFVLSTFPLSKSRGSRKIFCTLKKFVNRVDLIFLFVCLFYYKVKKREKENSPTKSETSEFPEHTLV